MGKSRLNPAAPEFVSPSSSPIADSYLAQAMSQQLKMSEDWALEANLSEHDLEELEEAEAWISLQAQLAEQEEEQERLLFQ